MNTFEKDVAAIESAMLSEVFAMRTAFGRRYGWEIQKLMLGRHPYYRMTDRVGACGPASSREVALWRLAKLPLLRADRSRSSGERSADE